MSHPAPQTETAQRLADAIFIAVPVAMSLFMALALTLG